MPGLCDLHLGINRRTEGQRDSASQHSGIHFWNGLCPLRRRDSAAGAFFRELDAFTLELWAALLRGGRSVLAYERIQSAQEIRKYVQARGVNTLWLTAALFNSIVESDV